MITKAQVELWDSVAQQYDYTVKYLSSFNIMVVSKETDDTFYIPEVFADYVERKDYSQDVRAFKVSYCGFGTIADDRIEAVYWERLVKAHKMCEELNKIVKENTNE